MPDQGTQKAARASLSPVLRPCLLTYEGRLSPVKPSYTAGLYNPSLSCYLNSSLQLLSLHHSFLMDLFSLKDASPCALLLRATMASMLSCREVVTSPLNLLTCLSREFPDVFSLDRQETAETCLTTLLSLLEGPRDGHLSDDERFHFHGAHILGSFGCGEVAHSSNHHIRDDVTALEVPNGGSLHTSLAKLFGETAPLYINVSPQTCSHSGCLKPVSYTSSLAEFPTFWLLSLTGPRPFRVESVMELMSGRFLHLTGPSSTLGSAALPGTVGTISRCN